MTAHLRVGLLACLLLAMPSSRAWTARADHRLVLGLAIWPQFEQFIGDRSLPAELYRIEVLRPFGHRTRIGAEFGARADFLILGAVTTFDVWRTRTNEWRVALGLDYALPLGRSESVHRAYTGEGSSLLDRLHARVGLGQTFDLQNQGVALRIAYDARFMLRDSLLSVLEALDDGVDRRGTFVVHEVMAGVEFRWGRRR